jgi:hypothetical protein
LHHDGVEIAPREFDGSARTDAGRYSAEELIHQAFQARRHVGQREIRADQPHAAIDIVPDPSRRDDSFTHIERGHPADGESVSPMAIRHAEGIALNAWQAGNVGDLIKDALIHRLQNARRPINTCGHEHSRFFRRRDFPDFVGDPVHLHAGVQLHYVSKRYRRMFKKIDQQGRGERRGEGVLLGRTSSL